MAVVGDNRGQLNEEQMEISKKISKRVDDADITNDVVAGTDNQMKWNPFRVVPTF